MTTEAENILKAVYAAYDKNENYTISTPPSGSIHAYNMALKEIAPYIEFLKKNFCFAKAKPAVCPDCFFPVHKKNFCFAKAKPTARLLFSGSQGGI